MHTSWRSQYQTQILLNYRRFRVGNHKTRGERSLKNLHFSLDIDWRVGYIFSEISTESATFDLSELEPLGEDLKGMVGFGNRQLPNKKEG